MTEIGSTSSTLFDSWQNGSTPGPELITGLEGSGCVWNYDVQWDSYGCIGMNADRISTFGMGMSTPYEGDDGGEIWCVAE